MPISTLPGMSQRAYPDIREAKGLVVDALREYGNQSYSRLMMRTGLPENVLEKTLELLLAEKTVQNRVGGEDPVYAMAERSWYGQLFSSKIAL